MKKVIILEHVASEKAGTILDFLKRHDRPYEEIKLFEISHQFPKIEEISHLVVMGGPMNVYEEHLFPFLKEENIFIQQVLKAGIPYFGVCLGSQLLAKALSTKVYKAKAEEIGWDTVQLLPDASKDSLLGTVGENKLKVLQWHGDTFDLPPGAAHLASSGLVPHQAYRVGESSYGFQFHIEVNRAMLEEWFKNRENLDDILKEYDSYRPQLDQICEKIFTRFFCSKIAD